MQALIQSNVNKAHVVLQSLGHASADTPLTGVINTKRPKMSQKQMAASYLKSVEGNPNTDAYKIRAKEASSKANNKRNAQYFPRHCYGFPNTDGKPHLPPAYMTDNRFD